MKHQKLPHKCNMRTITIKSISTPSLTTVYVLARVISRAYRSTRNRRLKKISQNLNGGTSTIWIQYTLIYILLPLCMYVCVHILLMDSFVAFSFLVLFLFFFSNSYSGLLHGMLFGIGLLIWVCL